MRMVFAALVLLFAFAAPVAAEDVVPSNLARGFLAYDRGDYETAFPLFVNAGVKLHRRAGVKVHHG